MASYEGLQTMRVQVANRVAWVTIDHPPVNLFDQAMFLDLARLVPLLEVDEGVGAVVFRSADREFFVSHADVKWILALPAIKPPRPTEIGPFVGLMERLRRLPKPTIGMIDGIARGGGSELLLALDMRFAGRTRTRLAQPEVALGIIPGGGGTQRLGTSARDSSRSRTCSTPRSPTRRRASACGCSSTWEPRRARSSCGSACSWASWDSCRTRSRGRSSPSGTRRPMAAWRRPAGR